MFILDLWCLCIAVPATLSSPADQVALVNHPTELMPLAGKIKPDLPQCKLGPSQCTSSCLEIPKNIKDNVSIHVNNHFHSTNMDQIALFYHPTVLMHLSGKIKPDLPQCKLGRSQCELGPPQGTSSCLEIPKNIKDNVSIHVNNHFHSTKMDQIALFYHPTVLIPLAEEMKPDPPQCKLSSSQCKLGSSQCKLRLPQCKPRWQTWIPCEDEDYSMSINSMNESVMQFDSL
jgi:uncharacterized Zn-finger protein